MTRFLPGVPVEHVLGRLAKAGGKEVETGKLESPQSSAALAVNAFGWFVSRPALLPSFDEDGPLGAIRVEVEYCARFPWRGGRHPWLDAVAMTAGKLIGVESKRFEPFRDSKAVNLSASYDRKVWDDDMEPYERVRDDLRSGRRSYRHLDAAQLVKHAFGLVTESRRLELRATLIYLFAEPQSVSTTALAKHRAEIEDFAAAVAGANVTFHWSSYREWLGRWPALGPDVAAHAASLTAAFEP